LPTASDDPRHWLALARVRGLGAGRCVEVLRDYPDPADLFAAGPRAWERLGLPAGVCKWLAEPDWQGVDLDLRWLEGERNHLVTWLDEDYPRLLREIPEPPPVLFVHGERPVLSDLQIAMVGSRSPTPMGERTARDFARSLARSGLTITSGLALGVDTAAHQGALDAGGVTVAVTGCGLDRVYPARNRDLAHRIAERGALVSEFPIGVPPLAKHFPRRNRIISGLSLGVLVVEAALRSGSLITARTALEQDREVFAIPGSIHNPRARGCNALIRQGAKLVESADDVLQELGPLALAALETPAEDDGGAPVEELDGDYRRLLDGMGYEPVTVDFLVDRSGLTAEAVSSMLLILELRGLVAPAPGGLYCRVES
jgi:DNA processing protein